MADNDTKVLYLENPPLSAPPASYLIGVRLKNLGVNPAAASGYVQVFDKGTGLLVGTFQVASAEMDPDEEKQAFATVALDLTEAAPGEQYIFSGDITSPGDMVRSNDILNPTTITIVDEPPPPPPPVASHASQHEDAGSDELDLTGLHGVLGTPQPYADHATAHENGGDDQVSLEGLTGQAVTPQIAADHGNERHVVPFLYSSELTNHENDETPHGPATSLEKTANKGQVDGYAGLDGGGLVPHPQLGPGGNATTYLNGAQAFTAIVGNIDPSRVLIVADSGSALWGARYDHMHNMSGALVQRQASAVQYIGPADQVGNAVVDVDPASTIMLNLRLDMWGEVFGAGPRPLSFAIHFGNTGTQADTQIGIVTATVDPAVDTPLYRLSGTCCLRLNHPSILGNLVAEHTLLYGTPAAPGITNPMLPTLSLYNNIGTIWNGNLSNVYTVYNLTPGGGPDWITVGGGAIYVDIGPY